MGSIIQRSFSAGEISPNLYSRVDTNRYASGLRKCRNAIVQKHGGVANRPGSVWIGEAQGGGTNDSVRLIPFIFNSSQAYTLEFGHQYMRVIKNGSYIFSNSVAISGITNAIEGVVTTAAHGMSDGDYVYISGVVGMEEVNNRFFKVDVQSPTTFKLQFTDTSTYVNTADFGTYTSGGTSYQVFRLTTPYSDTQLADIKYVQSADVMTLVHPNYRPRNLSRTSDTSWSLAVVTSEPATTPPTGLTITPAAGANTYRYKVTALSTDTFEESLAGTEHSKTITAISKANPAVVTYSGADDFANGDLVTIRLEGTTPSMTEVLDIEFEIANVNGGANTFELKGIDSTNYTTYVNGTAKAYVTAITTTAGAEPNLAAPHVIAWTAAANIAGYNIYKEANGVFGFIGFAKGNSFNDVGIDPDTSKTNPVLPGFNKPFSTFSDSATGTNFPATASYFQQRRIFANFTNDIELIKGSRTGYFTNFSISSPIQDDDSISFVIAGRQVNEVKHIIDLVKPVVFTSAGEWILEGGSSGLITPFEVNPKQHSYYGANDLIPIVTGASALFVQARGSIVRDLAFDFNIDGYRGNDLTVFSSHLVDGFELVDWTFQQTPHSIIWSVRDDGTLLGLTYIRDQEIIGWHRHDFQGDEVISACSIPEGDEDALYLAISRSIDGGTAQSGVGGTKVYIERLATRRIDEDAIEDAIFLDVAETYDGEIANETISTISNTFSGTTGGWTSDDIVALTTFGKITSADIGQEIHVTGSDGTKIRFTIIDQSLSGPPDEALAKPNKTIPASMRGTLTTALSFRHARNYMEGLWHLEGHNVSIFADGFVVASPNNPSYDLIAVNRGRIDLTRCYGKISVGLPITTDIQLLDIDDPSAETIADNHKNVGSVSMHVDKTRGVFAGPEEPDDDGTDGLYELKARDTESYDEPPALLTEVIEIHIRPEWKSNGGIFIRQVDPLPMSIGSVIPTGYIPLGRGRRK